MKLAILTQYYPPEMGAPQARLSELASYIAQRGHQVTVLTAMPNYPRGKLYPGYGGLLRREQYSGIDVIRSYIYPTKSVSLLKRLSNYFSFVISSFLAGSFLLPKVDYLMTESPPLFLGLSGYLLSRLKGARWIFNVSDLWPESALHLGIIREGASLRAAQALERFCYDKAWLVTGQSREILANIEGRFPAVETYHLSNGVDTTRFQPATNGATSVQPLLPSACTAIYGGLHGIAQGLDQILHAARQLQDLENFHILFVGDGPEKENLMRESVTLGLKNVHFEEAQPRDAMPALLSKADIALVPLKNRLPGAVPSKVYEGMAAGLSVLMIAEGEAADIVTRAKAGLVVKPGNIDGIASAMRRLAQNPDERRRFAQNGRDAAERLYDRQTIAKNFTDFLENNL